MKHPRLSTIFVAMSAASLLMASTLSYAGHNGNGNNHEAENYKCENYKAEVPPPCPPILVLHDGFYVGAGVGYDSFTVRHRHTAFVEDLTIVPPLEIFSHHLSFRHGANGWMGGLFVGYGRYFDCFYLGLEVNGNWSGATTSLHYTNFLGNDFRARVRARGSWGVALLPGIKVNDSSLLYARLGYLRTNFRGTGNFNFFDPVFGVPRFVSANNSRWVNGFQYGVGIETYVAEFVSVRGEFTHTSYNRRSTTRTVVLGTDRFIVRNRFNPSNNNFMLSLIYHFC